MSWWPWLLIGWVAVAVAAALWMGAAAADARRRERGARARHYSGEIQGKWRAPCSGDEERADPRRRLQH
ncbi:MAG TPA: hypothetical protein VIH08_11390 [Blastococcus sp.]